MFKKLLFLTAVLMLCNSCVSRTTVVKEPGLKGDNTKSASETELIWFWDKDF
jgi:hypothetical protein